MQYPIKIELKPNQAITLLLNTFSVFDVGDSIRFSSSEGIMRDSIDHFCYRVGDGYRHIKPYEMMCLLAGCKKSSTIFGYLLLAMAIEHGGFQFPLKGVRKHLGNILLNAGIKREGSCITVFHDIDNKIVTTSKEAFDSSLGWEWQRDIEDIPTGKQYAVDRLFEKFSNEPQLTVRHLEKANCDLVEDLFGMPFESLPKCVQESPILIPQDMKTERFTASQWRQATIWPVALQIYMFGGLASDFTLSYEFTSNVSSNDTAIPVKIE